MKIELNTEQIFQLKAIKIICISIVIFSMTFVSCTIHNSYRIHQMSKEGIDPIEARCALANEDDKVCRLVLMKQAASK